MCIHIYVCVFMHVIIYYMNVQVSEIMSLHRVHITITFFTIRYIV